MVVKRPVTFEEALSMTGFGRFNFLALLINITLMAGITFEATSVAFLVPASACELNTTSEQQGLIAGIPLLGIIATSHFMGYFADTRGRRKVLGWSMSIAFVVGAVAAFSPNWIVFCILKFLSSSALSGIVAVSLTLLSECTPQHQRPILVALTTTVISVTAGVMAVIAIPILQLKFAYYIPCIDIYFTPWRLLNIVFASTCALGAVVVFSSYESPKYLLSVGEEKKALEVLEKCFVLNSGKSVDNYGVSSLILGEDTAISSDGLFSSLVSQTLPLFKPPLLKNMVLLSVLITIAYSGINPFQLWLPFIVDGIMKAKENGEDNRTFCEIFQMTKNTTISENKDCSLNTSAMIIIFVFSLVIAVVNVFLSVVVNYVGRKRMVIGVQLVAGIAGLCINATSSLIISMGSLIFYMTGIVNYGFLSIFCVDLFPTYVKAMAVCIALMFGRSGTVASVNILKSMLNTNCELAMYGFSGFVIVGGLVALLLPSDVKEKSNDSAGSK